MIQHTDHASDRGPRPATHTPHVRRVRSAEYAAVGDLTVAAYDADGLLSRTDGSYDHYAPQLRDTATRDRQAEVWVAVDEESTLLGTVTWCLPGSRWRELARRPTQGEFRMLAVAPQARRRGAARALVVACVARARTEGIEEIVLSSLPQMRAAQELYRSLGFVRAPEHDHHPIPPVSLWAFRLDLTSGADRSVDTDQAP